MGRKSYAAGASTAREADVVEQENAEMKRPAIPGGRNSCAPSRPLPREVFAAVPSIRYVRDTLRREP